MESLQPAGTRLVSVLHFNPRCSCVYSAYINEASQRTQLTGLSFFRKILTTSTALRDPGSQGRVACISKRRANLYAIFERFAPVICTHGLVHKVSIFQIPQLSRPAEETTWKRLASSPLRLVLLRLFKRSFDHYYIQYIKFCERNSSG